MAISSAVAKRGRTWRANGSCSPPERIHRAQLVAPAGNDVSHAPAGVVHVARVAWDHADVEMGHRPSGGVRRPLLR